MDQQDTWKQQQQQKQCPGLCLGATGSITDKIYKQNLEPNYVNSLYLTQHNTCNIFSLLATDEDNDEDEKTTIINKQTPKTMETAYSTYLMKIKNKEYIEYSGSTVHFLLPGTPVNNLQPAIKPISINISGRSKLRSTHTCNLDIDGIPETENLEHTVPGLAYASLISIIILCNAGFKVQYDEKYVVYIIITNLCGREVDNLRHNYGYYHYKTATPHHLKYIQ